MNQLRHRDHCRPLPLVDHNRRGDESVLSGAEAPFIARRLLIMVPTLIVISIVVFTIIQIPPGTYIDSKIMELEQQGGRASAEEIQAIRDQYNLDDPVIVQYFKWSGLAWFTSFDSADRGVLQGFLGYSMAAEKPVNDLLGDRFLLTFAISFGTIIFTWLLAIPTGIYSAVRQYSVGDYVFTFIGFIGMCIPSFSWRLFSCSSPKNGLG